VLVLTAGLRRRQLHRQPRVPRAPAPVCKPAPRARAPPPPLSLGGAQVLGRLRGQGAGRLRHLPRDSRARHGCAPLAPPRKQTPKRAQRPAPTRPPPLQALALRSAAPLLLEASDEAAAYLALVAATACCGAAGAGLQAVLFGLAGQLGAQCAAALINGQAVAGIVSCAFRVRAPCRAPAAPRAASSSSESACVPARADCDQSVVRRRGALRGASPECAALLRRGVRRDPRVARCLPRPSSPPGCHGCARRGGVVCGGGGGGGGGGSSSSSSSNGGIQRWTRSSAWLQGTRSSAWGCGLRCGGGGGRDGEADGGRGGRRGRRGRARRRGMRTTERRGRRWGERRVRRRGVAAHLACRHRSAPAPPPPISY